MATAAADLPAADLPAAAYRAALASLPWATHRLLRRVLANREPEEAWRNLLAGRSGLEPRLAASWRSAARRVDLAAFWAAHRAAGVAVLAPGEPGFPAALESDPEPPCVLFRLGSPSVLESATAPAVAIVGTRRCTQYGRDVARELGHDLASAGVRIVSGLALGIDAAAHAGVLLAEGTAAPPLGVVGSGLDVVYPHRHAELWRKVAAAGALISEAPLGVRPEPWRFPLRNRLIAALGDVVVVVESHEAGGSMHTVDAAIARGRTVLAVPGPVRSRASAGTNRLLAEGVPPVRDAADVLVALGLEGRAPQQGRHDPRPPPDRDGLLVLEALGWEPASLDQVAERVDAPLGPVAMHLARLERDGWVVQHGSWWERVTRP